MTNTINVTHVVGILNNIRGKLSSNNVSPESVIGYIDGVISVIGQPEVSCENQDCPDRSASVAQASGVPLGNKDLNNIAQNLKGDYVGTGPTPSPQFKSGKNWWDNVHQPTPDVQGDKITMADLKKPAIPPFHGADCGA